MFAIIFLCLHSFQINSNHKDSLSHVFDPRVFERPVPQVDQDDLCERKCLAGCALFLVGAGSVAALSADFYSKVYGHTPFQERPFGHIKMH